MPLQITIMSVDVKPPVYFEVRKCVRVLRPNTVVIVGEGEDPERKVFEAVFPGWKLDFRGCQGSVNKDAVSAAVFNSGDHTMRIDRPSGSGLQQANMLITTRCPHPRS